MASAMAALEACLRVRYVRNSLMSTSTYIPDGVALDPSRAHLRKERRYPRSRLRSGSTPRGKQLTVQPNNADDTLTWKSQRLHLGTRHYGCDVKRQGRSVLTDAWSSTH